MIETVAKVAISNQTATTSHAKTSLSSGTSVAAVSGTPKAPARARVRNLPFPQNHLPIHQNVLDADRSLMRLLERRAVDHGRRIEHCDVGEHPGLQEPAIGEAHALRRERRHLAHGELERKELLVARIVAKDPREGTVGARVRGLRAQR